MSKGARFPDGAIAAFATPVLPQLAPCPDIEGVGVVDNLVVRKLF
ncbi:MAG TPA: hypothetical protein VFP44_01560 [Usitatibacter sp.]|nr:hypothetical protein [Usitatibacter sp.]